MNIVLATKNRKKIEEIRRILAETQVVVSGLDAYPDAPDVVEDGATFADNAAKKARAIAAFTGTLALADDSGLVVDALDGAPGVYSARYAGVGATDAENVAKLMDALTSTPLEGRTARFECVLALASPDGAIHCFSGTVEGSIAFTQAGANGFGYDPVFVPQGYDQTFAEMTSLEKDALSHRGRALLLFQKTIRASSQFQFPGAGE